MVGNSILCNDLTMVGNSILCNDLTMVGNSILFTIIIRKESCNVSNLTNSEKSDAAFGPLMWVWLLSMFKVRMCAVSMVICLLFIKRENFKLTVAAKVSN